MRNLLLATVMASFVGATAAQAGIIAYTNDLVPTTYLQQWRGPLGLDFLVNAPVSVTHLGAFINGNDANFAGSDGSSGIQVGLWDRTSTSWVVNLTTLTASNTTALSGDAGDRFFALTTPIQLNAGDTYRLVTTNVVNYNSEGAANPYSTTDSGYGHLSFLANASYQDPGYTGSPEGFYQGYTPFNRFTSGTLAFELVPEPGSVAVFGMALVAVFALRRRSVI